MKRMHWTWDQLQNTPSYVIDKCVEMLIDEQDDMDEAMS